MMRCNCNLYMRPKNPEMEPVCDYVQMMLTAWWRCPVCERTIMPPVASEWVTAAAKSIEIRPGG
jgi:hypothetical protein